MLGRVNDSTVLQYELDPPPGEKRERPLFVHSNLLKHISGVSQGETFTHIVRMALRWRVEASSTMLTQLPLYRNE
jgi:alpha 1,2-mannosyltransferase